MREGDLGGEIRTSIGRRTSRMGKLGWNKLNLDLEYSSNYGNA
jgi:hypothetical protein